MFCQGTIRLIRPIKVVLFPEISRVKLFLSLTRPHSRMCIRIYIFCFKALNICGKSNGIRWYHFRMCCVLLTDVIESWSSPGWSHESNAVHVQWGKPRAQNLLYYNNIWNTHFQERKSLRDTFVYKIFFYICLFVTANLVYNSVRCYFHTINLKVKICVF